MGEEIEAESRNAAPRIRVIPFEECLQLAQQYNSEVDYTKVFVSLMEHLKRSKEVD